jgi:Uma2 family endonuclease
MTTLIADPAVAERLIAERRARGWDRKDEVWDGVYIVMPDPNVDHQFLVGRLTAVFSEVIHTPAGGVVYPGLNLSDRTDDWKQNFRCPDVAVFLAGNDAEVFEAHICGPADFLVEIVSPGDKSREKLDFYGDLRVRELLLIDRYPWSLELYRHNGSELVPAGRSSAEHSEVIASAVLPISFQLLSAAPRPEIRMAEIGGARTWTA